MEITEVSKVIKENSITKKDLKLVFKQFNQYLDLVEEVNKKEFKKNLPKELKNAGPVFDEIIQNVFFTIRKAYNEVHDI